MKDVRECIYMKIRISWSAISRQGLQYRVGVWGVWIWKAC